MKNGSIILALTAVMIAGIAQLVLKASANRTIEKPLLKKVFNIKVGLAYGLMLCSSFLNVIALRHLELKLVPVIEAIGFLWVPILSVLFLKEKLSKQNILGCGIIVVGIGIFAIGS